MALHWKELKGFYKASGNNVKYTILDFKDSSASGENCLPQVYFGDSSTTHGTDLGHLVSTGVNNSFTQDQYISKGKSWGWINTTTKIGRNNDNLFLDDGTQTVLQINGTAKLTVTANAVTIAPATTIQSTLSVSSSISGSSCSVTGNLISSQGYCAATYFNATSDRRAKENLIAMPDGMLNIVKNLKLYSYDYKDSKIPSIGIIAQDVKDIQINNFKFVDNENASGEDGDYMAVKESKLVYILIKAVQELSAEVDELKKRLGE